MHFLTYNIESDCCELIKCYVVVCKCDNLITLLRILWEKQQYVKNQNLDICVPLDFLNIIINIVKVNSQSFVVSIMYLWWC